MQTFSKVAFTLQRLLFVYHSTPASNICHQANPWRGKIAKLRCIQTGDQMENPLDSKILLGRRQEQKADTPEKRKGRPTQSPENLYLQTSGTTSSKRSNIFSPDLICSIKFKKNRGYSLYTFTCTRAHVLCFYMFNKVFLELLSYLKSDI